MSAFKDLLGLMDDKLQEVFHRKEPDITSLRERAASSIEATKTKFLATEPVKGRKDFRVGNSVVEYSPTVKGQALPIDGKSTVYVPSEHFESFLDKLAKHVGAGSFDDVLKGGGDASPTPAPRSSVERKPRADAGKPRGGWSEERRQKHEAKKAAKG